MFNGYIEDYIEDLQLRVKIREIAIDELTSTLKQIDKIISEVINNMEKDFDPYRGRSPTWELKIKEVCKNA